MRVTLSDDFEERVGGLLDELAGEYPVLAEAVASFVRERRGKLRAGAFAPPIGRQLEQLAAELDALTR